MSKETVFEFPAIWLVENSLFHQKQFVRQNFNRLGTQLLCDYKDFARIRNSRLKPDIFSVCDFKRKVKSRIHWDIPKSFLLHLLAIFVVLLYKWIDFNQYCRVKDDTFSNFPSSSPLFSIHAFSPIMWKVLLFIPFSNE